VDEVEVIEEGGDFVIKFRCRNCNQKIRVPKIHADKKGRCPKCKNIVVVPKIEKPSPVTSQSKTTKPTLKLDTGVFPSTIQQGTVMTVHHRIKDVATSRRYKLRLWVMSIDGATEPYRLNSNMLWESPDWINSDDDIYEHSKQIPMILYEAGVAWFSIEWEGGSPAGNVPGFVLIKGEAKVV